MTTLERVMYAFLSMAIVLIMISSSRGDDDGKHDAPVGPDWKDKVLIVYEKGRSSREP